MKTFIALLFALSPLQAQKNTPSISEVCYEPQILIYRNAMYGYPKIGTKIMVPVWTGEEHINFLCVFYEETYHDLLISIGYWYEVM